MLRQTILLWLVLEAVLCLFMDDLPSILNEAELLGIEKHLNGIVPGHLTNQHKTLKPIKEINEILEDNEFYKRFNGYIKEGMTMKGLTFNIYDDAMRNFAVTLLNLTMNLETSGFDTKTMINKMGINEDLMAYVSDINMLYRESNIGEAIFIPPFINKPNFFVNNEVIFKALKLTRQKYYEYLQSNNSEALDMNNIVIDTNYSGWNLPKNGGDEEFNYFREDISLNGYYYGMNLMYPYWINNEDLDQVNSRHSEYYYHFHQQLVARYLLEHEFIKQGNLSVNDNRYSDFNPHLVHDNGLPFPVRSYAIGDWSEDKEKVKAIDIAIKECMSRKLVIMNNSTTIAVTEENYVNVLSKLIRANYDGIKTAKIIRSIFGYGGNGYPYDVYNPSPSVLHYPETSLRDPAYWYMIKYALDYFTEYEKTIEPWDISKYESDEVHIFEVFIPKIFTYFDYYQFSINKALNRKNTLFANLPIIVTARQKRIKHSQFTFNFAVSTRKAENVVVRLFIGPPCSNDCWQHYTKFFELDKYEQHLHEGINFINWSPDKSKKYSNDDFYNLEKSEDPELFKTNKYNIFKFPDDLVIPRGLDKGLNLTLFVMILPVKDLHIELAKPKSFYGSLLSEVDNQPLGFPFHRPAVGYNPAAKNYKFYKLTIYHKRNKVVKNESFSTNLL